MNSLVLGLHIAEPNHARYTALNPAGDPPQAAVFRWPSTHVLDGTPKISWIKGYIASVKACWDISTLDSFEASISTNLDLNTQSLWRRVLRD